MMLKITQLILTNPKFNVQNSLCLNEYNDLRKMIIKEIHFIYLNEETLLSREEII